jgi:protein-tyrosine phosphatase
MPQPILFRRPIEEMTMSSIDPESTPRPIAASYWVEPGRLLAGEYPGALNEEAARNKLRAFLAVGVDTFYNLTTFHDPLLPYANLLAEEAEEFGHEVIHRPFQIMDLGVPTPEMMTIILDSLDDDLAEGRTVYVHCWGGIGRTGTVIGCWMVRHGIPAADALAFIQAGVDSTPKAGRRSPETNEQQAYVKRWEEWVTAGLDG